MTPAPPPAQVLHLTVAYPELPDQVLPHLVPDLVIAEARRRGDENRVATEIHIRHAYEMEPVAAQVLESRTWVQRAKDLVADAWTRIKRDLFTDALGRTVQRHPQPMQPPPPQDLVGGDALSQPEEGFDPFEGLPATFHVDEEGRLAREKSVRDEQAKQEAQERAERERLSKGQAPTKSRDAGPEKGR